MDAINICDFQCVTEDMCGEENPLLSYGDRDTWRCGACTAPACQKCGSTAKECSVCQEGYILDGKVCLSPDRRFWWGVYFLLFCIVGAVISYLVDLAMRPVVNPKALEHGLKYRSQAKMRAEGTSQLLSVRKTNLRRFYDAGIGVTLHFRWQYLVILYAAACFVFLYLVAVYFGKRPALMKAGPLDSKSYDACNYNVEGQLKQIAEMETVYFFVTFALYILTTVASFWITIQQRRFCVAQMEQSITMQDYALRADGLPRQSGTENVEYDLKHAFEETLKPIAGTEVIGVSVCWDYTKEEEQVQEQVTYEVDQEEIRLEELEQGHVTPREGEVVSKGLWKYSLRNLDAIFGVGGEEEEDHVHPKERSEAELNALCQVLRSSGCAYVVFGTECQRDRILAHFQNKDCVVLGKKITLNKPTNEPDTVLWQNFGVLPSAVLMNMVLGAICLTFALGLLDIFFYFPSVAYFLSVSDVNGMTQGGMQGTLLGLLVVICNQIIYAIIGKIADKCGFRGHDSHQTFYVVGYTFAVFVNTIIDLMVILLLAQGYSVEQAMEMQVASDSTLSTKSIAENPSLQKAIYEQYIAYIFPSCLLLPYILEPIGSGFLFLLMQWIVRSRREVSEKEAEAKLACPPFDLARYGDILINVMLCVGTMAFTYRDLWKIFFCLTISLMWIYFWDSVRFLRFSSRGSFVSGDLDETACWLSAAPCAILAGCLVFRAYAQKSGDGYGFMESIFKEVGHHAGGITNMLITRDTIPVVMFCAMAFHMFVHYQVLKRYLPEWTKVHVEHDLEVPYEEKAQEIACNWFNANPMYCLRSKYFYKHSTPCMNFSIGKEHILKVNINDPHRHADEPPLYFQPKAPQLEHSVSFVENWRSAKQELLDELGEDKEALTDLWHNFRCRLSSRTADHESTPGSSDPV